MNPVIAVESIAQFLEAELVNIRPDGDRGTEREITVYRYNLPDPAPAQMAASQEITADSYEGMMPAVVVSPIAYEDKSIEDGYSILTVVLQVGAFSRDEQNVQGPWAVMNILERIRRLLLTYRTVEGYEVIEPLTWQLFDESTKPIWLGEMITTWRILTPFRIDAEDWKGDFLERT